MFFSRRPISRLKIENFTRTKSFYFLILHSPAKFQDSRFNNKKSKKKWADLLKRYSKLQEDCSDIDTGGNDIYQLKSAGTGLMQEYLMSVWMVNF